MKKDQDLERGLFITGPSPAKVYINVNEESSERQLPSASSIKNDPSSSKRAWIVHIVVVLLSCGLSAGAGFALFVGQRANQLVSFQTQFDR